MAEDKHIYEVELFDDQRRVTVDELTRLCGVPQSLVIELVEEGVLEPMEMRAGQWSFSGTCIRRVQIAVRLQRDLEVNPAGIALALDLLDELEDLRRRLQRW